MTQPPSIIGIIPARYGSTRLPAKALADICGVPMVCRVFEQVKKSKLLNRVIVATDDARIEAVVRAYSGDVVMTPTTCSSGSDRCAAVARTLEADLIVNIQGDEPLISPEMIDCAISPLVADPEILMGTIARPMTKADDLHDPAVVKVVLDGRGRALYFSRSVIPHVRDCADRSNWIDHAPFYKHFGLYVYRKDFLLRFASMPQTPLEKAEGLEQLRALVNGFAINVALTQLDSIGVDTAGDLARVVEIIKGTA